MIVAITIIGCVYALKWYAVYKEESLSTTIITDFIQEIKKEEFLNYMSENPSAVIYYGVTSDPNCRKFEKKFKKFILNNNLKETIVYMNVNELVGNDFSTKLDGLYNTPNIRATNKYFGEVPAVAVYDHTTLIDFVSGSNLSVDEVKELLSEYHLIGQ